jgi:Asp-tRNA(Asn)/Glu-tRNA(Gln) amidotransferase A subunit family amidase
VVEAHLRRIEKLNPKLNAIVTLAPDAIDKAHAAEKALIDGRNLGALHGVPITIKDTIETGNLRTTSGSRIRADFIPDGDAPAVARLKAAGAIILGKTNTAEMAMDYTADNPVFDRTNNPYDLSKSPGGSSGGEAAAIATCLSPAGIGSDLAGSIRIPAHFCGVVGLKPTTGRVPGDGQFPPSTGPYSLGAVIGPMARTVADVDLLFRVLAGMASQSPNSLRERWEGIRGWRAAWYTDDGISPVTEETRDAVEIVVRVLAEAGLLVRECRPSGVERGHELWLKLFSQASVVQLCDVYTGNEEKAGPFVRWRLASAADKPPQTLDDYIRVWMERDRLRAALIEWMETTPLIIAPVGGTSAFEHDAQKVMIAGQILSTFRAFSYSQTFNLFDLPAVTVQAGRSKDGLPIGVQIIGRPFEELAVMAAALIVEEALGGWQPPAVLSDKL